MASYFDDHNIPDPAASQPQPPAHDSSSSNPSRSRNWNPDVSDFMTPAPASASLSSSTSSVHDDGISFQTPENFLHLASIWNQLRTTLSVNPENGTQHGILDSLITQLLSEANASARAPPASKFFISNLPTVPMKDLLQSHCSICVEPFSSGGTAKRLPCNHIFHFECIKPWLKLHNTCPFCRYECPTDDKEYEKKRKAAAKAKGSTLPEDEDDEDPNNMYG